MVMHIVIFVDFSSLMQLSRSCVAISLKQLGMGSGADEVDGVSGDLIDQQKIAADMAFPVVGPFAY